MLAALKTNIPKWAWRTYRTLGLAIAAKEAKIRRLPGPWGPLIEFAGYCARRFVFTPASRSTSFVHGVELRFDPADVDAGPFLLGSYEEGTSRLFEQLLEPGMVVVDVGAHVGYYTLLAARRVGPNGKVYAFEPHPRNFALLKRNCELNGFRNVIALPMAVSSHSGYSRLYLSHRARTGLHSLYPNRYASHRTVVVESTTLDGFFEKQGWPRLDLLKMDIEGAELAALEGSKQLLQRMPTLKWIVEFFPATLDAAGVVPADFLDTLLSLDFSIDVIDEDLGITPLDVPQLIKRLSAGPLAVNLLCQRRQTRAIG